MPPKSVLSEMQTISASEYTAAISAAKGKEMESMKKKINTSELIFSAFLCLASIVCAYMFINLLDGATGLQKPIKTLITAILFVVIGLILFFATRIGDGKQIKRFSPATLIILDLPALYVIIASIVTSLPLGAQISAYSEVMLLASLLLGYGIPYTFVSGYELDTSDEEENDDDSDTDEENAESDTEETDSDEEEEEDDDDFIANYKSDTDTEDTADEVGDAEEDTDSDTDTDNDTDEDSDSSED